MRICHLKNKPWIAHEKCDLVTFYSYKDIEKLEKFLSGKPVSEQEIGRQLIMETISFAETATLNDYTKPEVNKSYDFEVYDSRHPVIEHSLEETKSYIPNDIKLNRDNQQILMINYLSNRLGRIYLKKRI